MQIKYNAEAERFDVFLAPDPYWRAEYDIVKAAGFRFERGTFAWHTTDVERLRSLYLYKPVCGIQIDPSAVEKARELKAEKIISLEGSRATDADVEIPVPEGINPATGKTFAYLPYQKAGIAYALRRRHTLIADEMGLGKTIQAIGISNADETIRRVLIICPATLKLNWKKEWLKWDVKHLSVGLVSQGRKGKFPDAHVIIINFDLLSKWQEPLRACEWDLMIVDECHYLKEGKTARTQEVFGRKRARKRKVIRGGEKTEIEAASLPPIRGSRRVFLTGTPIVNRPKELWLLVQALDPDGLGKDWRAFMMRYCGAVKLPIGIWSYTGASNLDELQDKMRSAFMVRRLKRDVLKELPPKIRQVIPLEIDGLTVKQRKLLLDEKELHAKVESDFESPAFEDLSKVRKEIALLKLPFAIEMIKQMLDETEKIVVFAHHHECIDALAEAFSGVCAVLDGRMGETARQSSVDLFQSDPRCRVFIGGIAAAGVGITLTEASTVVFVELDWVPGNLSQAEDRCHRIGQKGQVLVKHLVLQDSLDEYMANVLIEKQAVIDQALDSTEAA